MSVCSVAVLALFATAVLLLPSTHGTALSDAQAAIKKLQEQVAQLSQSISTASNTAGSTYVRWGSASCPTSAKLVYSGVVGGGHYAHGGAAVNALCMPLNPVYDSKARTSYISYLYGAEYETIPENRHNVDVVCAVCISAREVQMMVPATNVCPGGWTLEFSGYLMAGHYTHASATQYLCMDNAQEYVMGSQTNNDGKLFYYVLGQCGSLPCPPYDNDKVLTCVVCSK